MIYEEAGWHVWLIRYFSLLVEVVFPALCSLHGLGIGGISHYNAARNVADVQGLEGCLSAHVGALIPQLHSDFLAINFENFEGEILINPHMHFLLDFVSLGC